MKGFLWGQVYTPRRSWLPGARGTWLYTWYTLGNLIITTRFLSLVFFLPGQPLLNAVPNSLVLNCAK